MDLYTTSFSYPHPKPHSLRSNASPLAASALNLPGSASAPPVPLPNVTSATAPAKKATGAPVTWSQVEKEWEAIQKLALDITSREGCLVTVSKESVNTELGATQTGPGPESDTSAAAPTAVWNFHLSGGYQSVMAARGAILREIPRDNRTCLKVPRTDILESPLAAVSPLKPDVRRRLDEIASESKAHIAVMNFEIPGGSMATTVLATADGSHAGGTDAVPKLPASESLGTGSDRTSLDGAGSTNTDPNSVKTTSTTADTLSTAATTAGTSATSNNGTVTYGLETERMCELVITGDIENVEIAKVRLLVMLDEFSGLHAEFCDIDYKLHNIIASRKRCVIQSIQEDTATNIYLPISLVGVLNAPQPGSQQNTGYRNMTMGHQNANLGMPMGGMGMNAPGMGMGMGSQQPHLGGMGMGGHHAHNQHLGHQQPHQPHRGNHPPIYNPHQHVQFPYQPQPMDINPQTTRGMPYSGPGIQHYGHGHHGMNGMNSPHPGHGGPPPMSVNHTGMSHMSHTSHAPSQYSDSRMVNNMSHLSVSPLPGHAQPHGFNLGHGAPHRGPGHMGLSGHNAHTPGMGMNMPFPANGQHHPHVGPGGHMGMQQPQNIGMGMHGMNPQGGPGVGPFGAGSHPGLNVHGGEQGKLGKANQIWITGEFFGVQRARDMLLNVAMQKSKLVISRDTAILPRKLDWLLTERLEEVKSIMSDNGTYIQVPSVGSQASLITVFGDHRVNIERTIRSVMGLACQFYVASFWLLPISFDVLMPQATLNPAQMQPILKRISHETGAEVVFKSNCFEMHGLEQEVRAAVMLVLELDIILSFHHEIRFQIELANEHREFISGKKNGKINKIMKMAGVKIKFETFNDYNFLMDISGSDLGSIQGLSMLQEELPAEVSFHVPESYHKRIIGVGGKNIQRIMKLYGVYVKFSNAEEFAALGGYSDNEDNVVARTPAKNAINLESLKQSVMEMVNPKDKDYTVECVSIPRRYHRTLLGEKSIFIHDIEQKTNSLVRFPYKETASDVVTIFGPESQVHIAAAMLLDHVPFEADLHVPPNAELTKLVTSTEFILFTEKIKRDHQIAIVPSAKFGQGDESIFKFRCQRSNIDFLGTARDSLEEFLAQHNIQVYPSNAQKRVDSFADAFFHFNSKLLAGGASKNAEGESENLVERRQRPVSVATDVKALFDGPQQPGGPYRSVDDTLGFAGPLSYHDPRRVPDYWQPSSVQSLASNHGRSEEGASKRDSDPIIEHKVRQASAPSHTRVSNRTQSLDITSLNFSRSLNASQSQSNFGPMPPSPNTGAITSSPSTATAQFFPGHGLRANTTGRNNMGSYDSAITDVTHGLNNISVTHQ